MTTYETDSSLVGPGEVHPGPAHYAKDNAIPVKPILSDQEQNAQHRGHTPTDMLLESRPVIHPSRGVPELERPVVTETVLGDEEISDVS